MASAASSSPAPVVPPLPAAARSHDAAGAQDFVRYWFDVVNYTFVSQDTRVFRSLCLPDCDFCTDFASRVERRRADGSRYEGGRFLPQVVVAPRPGSDGSVVVDVTVDVSRSQIRTAVGGVTDPAPGVTGYSLAVELRPARDRWEVSGVAT